jgi:hypothetical protein
MDRDTMTEIRRLKERVRSLEEMASTLCRAVRELDARTNTAPGAERIVCGCGDSMCSDCAGATP